MFESPLSKHAGPIAITAGGLLAITHVGQFLFFEPANLVATEANAGSSSSAPHTPSAFRCC